jgi:hypothetical protein
MTSLRRFYFWVRINLSCLGQAPVEDLKGTKINLPGPLKLGPFTKAGHLTTIVKKCRALVSRKKRGLVVSFCGSLNEQSGSIKEEVGPTKLSICYSQTKATVRLHNSKIRYSQNDPCFLYQTGPVLGHTVIYKINHHLQYTRNKS